MRSFDCLVLCYSIFVPQSDCYHVRERNLEDEKMMSPYLYLQHLANLCKGAFVQWLVCVCVCVCGFFLVDVFALTRSCLIPAYCFLSHGWAYHVSVDRDTKEIGPCTIIESSHIPPAKIAKVSSITSPVHSITYSSKSILAVSCK